MKVNLIPAIVLSMLIVGSCKKEQSLPLPTKEGNLPARKVRFELYTNENFAGNLKNIQFRLFMRKATRVLFDSSLATMKISEIPDSTHKIFIEKLVPENDTSTLTVGFRYSIENVGNSWYLETFPATDTFKLLRYPFQ